MERSNHSDRDYISRDIHVVDWQLVGTFGAAEVRDVRERIRGLETRAIALLRTAVTNPGTAEAQRSLAVLEGEIARLRADLAWRRAEAYAGQ